MTATAMLNVLSVDVEEYFQVEAFATTVSRNNWNSYPSRVERNVDRVLSLCERHSTQGTFFILGWVAERFPEIVKRIAAKGHEVGCHGYGHQRIHRQSREEFREDVRKAKALLQDLSGQAVNCYRAPSFSVIRETLWALEVLEEEGFKVDSSIFPVVHDFYGIPGAPRFQHERALGNGSSIVEFPPSTVRLLGQNVGIGGGGYLRFAPYAFTRWAFRRLNEREGKPAMAYFHPWELDPEQPRINAGPRSRLRHYTNLDKMESKLDRLLRDFRFAPLSAVCSASVHLSASRCSSV